VSNKIQNIHVVNFEQKISKTNMGSTAEEEHCGSWMVLSMKTRRVNKFASYHVLPLCIAGLESSGRTNKFEKCMGWEFH
jgi:hypothetical protein